VSYGRLHAPLEKEVIEWNSEKCRCWHRLESSPLLYFLDGVSATEINRGGYRLHPVFEAFRQFSINKGWDGPKYLAARNAFVWKHYGERFFDLFDVRNVDLWKEYRRYLEEHYLDREENYKRKGMVGIPFDPPRYMVC
jgi:hypothetical protein